VPKKEREGKREGKRESKDYEIKKNELR